MSSSMDNVRLFIRPLNEPLLERLVGGQRTGSGAVKDVSIHKTETDPENSFGFLTLPKESADALLRKFNHTTIMGKKISIQKAKPETWKDKKEQDTGNPSMDPPRTARLSRPVSRPFEPIVTGLQVKRDCHGNERHIQRGWIIPKRIQQKGSKGEKFFQYSRCAFKARIPPNRRADLKPTNKGSDSRSLQKKGRVTKSSRTEATILEFGSEKRRAWMGSDSSIAKGPILRTYFDEEKGAWVTEDGNVVETVERRIHPPVFPPFEELEVDIDGSSSSSEEESDLESDDESGSSEDDASSSPEAELSPGSLELAESFDDDYTAASAPKDQVKSMDPEAVDSSNMFATDLPLQDDDGSKGSEAAETMPAPEEVEPELELSDSEDEWSGLSDDEGTLQSSPLDASLAESDHPPSATLNEGVSIDETPVQPRPPQETPIESNGPASAPIDQNVASRNQNSKNQATEPPKDEPKEIHFFEELYRRNGRPRVNDFSFSFGEGDDASDEDKTDEPNIAVEESNDADDTQDDQADMAERPTRPRTPSAAAPPVQPSAARAEFEKRFRLDRSAWKRARKEGLKQERQRFNRRWGGY